MKLESHFRRDLNAVVVNSLPRHQFDQKLAGVLKREVSVILELPRQEDGGDGDGYDDDWEDEDMADGKVAFASLEIGLTTNHKSLRRASLA